MATKTSIKQKKVLEKISSLSKAINTNDKKAYLIKFDGRLITPNQADDLFYLLRKELTSDNQPYKPKRK